FELERAVKMIVDGTLAAAGDKEELLDAGCLRLFDRVMNERFVDDRQHLLRHRLGGRQKAGSQPGHRENGFANWPVHIVLERVRAALSKCRGHRVTGRPDTNVCLVSVTPLHHPSYSDRACRFHHGVQTEQGDNSPYFPCQAGKIRGKIADETNGMW